MKILIITKILLFLFSIICVAQVPKSTYVVISHYNVLPVQEPIIIDGNWYKEQWENSPFVIINNYVGKTPDFKPEVKAKMVYDSKNLYLIYKVVDRDMRCKTKKINGPVWEDSCVEFFFSPDLGYPLRYFNLEINCIGTPLMHYNRIAKTDIDKLNPRDIKKIDIAVKYDKSIGNVSDTTTWFMECRIPLDVLSSYANITTPEKGVKWQANFYKIAHKSKDPHYISWSPIESGEVDFHLPEYFGIIEFK